MSFLFRFVSSKEQPILDFLKVIKPELPWEKRIAQGRIRVDDCFVGRNYQLGVGNVVIYDPFRHLKEPTVDPHYQVLYQDPYLIAINKPAPLPIHPSGKYHQNTLTEIIKRQGHPWHTINRLDSETSGILLLVKDSSLISQFTKALKEARKIYLVLVEGIPPRKFEINLTLGRKKGSLVYKKRGENQQEGKSATTYFYRIRSWGNKSLLFALPKTGRTHQIRAHLRENGFCVVGDKIYGKDEKYFLEFITNGLTSQLMNQLELKRQFLHSYKISMTHPISKQRMIFKTGLPEELDAYLKKISQFESN